MDIKTTPLNVVYSFFDILQRRCADNTLLSVTVYFSIHTQLLSHDEMCKIWNMGNVFSTIGTIHR